MFKSIIRIPDFVEIQTKDGWKTAKKQDAKFSTEAAEVETAINGNTLDVVAVETAEQVGGWLWGLVPEKESFSVAYIKGFYLADVWKELMANLISAYIGAGITRKAFTLGK